MTKVLYSCILLVRFRSELLRIFEPKHPKVYAHHITLCFKPDQQYQNDFMNYLVTVNPTTTFNITGYVEDDYCQAVTVNIHEEEVVKRFSMNEFPHITISTAEGTTPVYSNELIKKGNIKKMENNMIGIGLLKLVTNKDRF